METEGHGEKEGERERGKEIKGEYSRKKGGGRGRQIEKSRGIGARLKRDGQKEGWANGTREGDL